MKIGILTFWWSQDNYGQLLQCYALQEYLKKSGHEVFLIRYNYLKDISTPLCFKILKILNLRELIRYLKKKENNKRITKEQITNDREFDKFREKYITQSDLYYYSYNMLKKNPPKADLYIVGSDQVWNFNIGSFFNVKKLIHAYMLDFGDDLIKRASYAASWGVTNLSSSRIKEIKPLLHKFNYVSVREKSGIYLCNQCGRSNVEWVPDPTLLLSAQNYRDLYHDNRIDLVKEKYIFLYMLNNTNDFNIQKVFDFATKKNMKVIYVTGNGIIDTRKKCFASIPQWLYLVDNAEYVVTNSFHCCVFSSIFNTKFGCVKLVEKFEGMNERLVSLFERLNIESRFVDNNELENVLEKDLDKKEFRFEFDIKKIEEE